VRRDRRRDALLGEEGADGVLDQLDADHVVALAGEVRQIDGLAT